MGYEIYYSINGDFTAAEKKIIRGTSIQVKKLKAKTKYYVRVRAYQLVKGRKLYSEWTSGSVKTKR